MSYVNVYNDNLRHCTCTPFSIDDAIPINFRFIHKNLKQVEILRLNITTILIWMSLIISCFL